MDGIDDEIAAMLQDDNRLPSAAIGDAVGLSVSAAGERVRRLNAAGVIRGNHALLDPERVGLPLCAFVFVDLAPHPDEAAFREAMRSRPEILEIHQVAGTHCYLLKVRASGPRSLQLLLAEHVKSEPAVLRTETVVVLETVKDTPVLPLREAERG